MSITNGLQSLIYYFIRSLIHRPAVCFADEQIRSPSVLAVSDSSKHIIQILQLLDERRLCLSMSINRKELVLMSGLGLLWQVLGLKRESKLAKESHRLLATILEELKPESATAAAEFATVAGLLVSLDSGSGSSNSKSQEVPAQQRSRSPKKQQVQSWKHRLSATQPTAARHEPSPSRRATICGASPTVDQRHIRSSSQNSLPLSSRPEQIHGASQYSPAGTYHVTPSSGMDYDSHARALSSSGPADVPAGAITVADWEFVLSDMDRGYSNIFTGIYGGKECGEDTGPFASLTAEYDPKPTAAAPAPVPSTMPMSASQPDLQDLSPEAWSATSSSDIPLKQEMLSYSEESLGGGSEDGGVAYQDLQMPPEEQAAASMMDPFRSIVIPTEEEIDNYNLVNGGWERRLAV